MLCLRKDVAVMTRKTLKSVLNNDETTFEAKMPVSKYPGSGYGVPDIGETVPAPMTPAATVDIPITPILDPIDKPEIPVRLKDDAIARPVFEEKQPMPIVKDPPRAELPVMPKQPVEVMSVGDEKKSLSRAAMAESVLGVSGGDSPSVSGDEPSLV